MASWSDIFVHDVYARFIHPGPDHRHLAAASRIASVAVLLLAGGASSLMRGMSVDEAWKFLAAVGAGSGAVFMLRGRGLSPGCGSASARAW